MRNKGDKFTWAQHDARFAGILTRWLISEYEYPSTGGKFASGVVENARDLAVKMIFEKDPEEAVWRTLDRKDPHDQALLELAKHIRQDSGF